MDDLISRQAAIDALMPIYKSASLRNRNVFSTARKCMAAIEDLPSAQPEPHWIPCSERLPEKHQMVITTIIGTDVIRMIPGETFEDALARVRNHVRVSVGYIEDDEWYGADGFPQIVQPIAWMPMPEPYKRGDEDGRS